jgi:DNA (cytosine-5)-methyltransferase 1
VLDDALAYLRDGMLWLDGGFDAIHASPPCQAYSVATKAWNGRIKRAEHPDLVGPTRELLDATGLPYVIENVVGAPLENPTMICGTMFDPPMAVQRHRLFETNWPFEPPTWPCRHSLWQPQFPPTRSDRTQPASTVSVFGAGGGRAKNFELWKWAMDIDWMSKAELAEAIPPAYTEFVGAHLLAAVSHFPTETAG